MPKTQTAAKSETPAETPTPKRAKVSKGERAIAEAEAKMDDKVVDIETAKPKAKALKLATYPERTCALEGCGKVFTPITATQFHHDDACAVQGFNKRNGMKLPLPGSDAPERQRRYKAAKAEQQTLSGETPAPIKGEVDESSSKATPRPKAAQADARHAELEKTYGPVREVTETLSENAASKKVRLSCGHTRTVPLPAVVGRCKGCLEGKAVGEAGAKVKRTPRAKVNKNPDNPAVAF